MVNSLQRDFPVLYKQLNKGTVSKWMVSGSTGKGWSEKTLANVNRHHAILGSGRVGILTPYPELVERIKTELQGIRDVGLPVTAWVARSVLLAIIELEHPQLLENKKFKCSEASESHDVLSIRGK